MQFEKLKEVYDLIEVLITLGQSIGLSITKYFSRNNPSKDFFSITYNSIHEFEFNSIEDLINKLNELVQTELNKAYETNIKISSNCVKSDKLDELIEKLSYINKFLSDNFIQYKGND